jgi:hypothetical protein
LRPARIKGTRRVFRCQQRSSFSLRIADPPKEIAELVITDLMRNDLDRFASSQQAAVDEMLQNARTGASPGVDRRGFLAMTAGRWMRSQRVFPAEVSPVR